MQEHKASSCPPSIFYDSTSLGLLKIEVKNAQICALKFASTPLEAPLKEPWGITLEANNKDKEIALLAFTQIKEYFQGERKTFDLPIKLSGTSFQKKIWDIIYSIPYGETRSYKEVALLAGQEKAARAVGMAAHQNPIILVVPCHRVIGSNGKLVGYAEGLDRKAKFLALEQAHKEGSLF